MDSVVRPWYRVGGDTCWARGADAQRAVQARRAPHARMGRSTRACCQEAALGEAWRCPARGPGMLLDRRDAFPCPNRVARRFPVDKEPRECRARRGRALEAPGG